MSSCVMKKNVYCFFLCLFCLFAIPPPLLASEGSSSSASAVLPAAPKEERRFSGSGEENGFLGGHVLLIPNNVSETSGWRFELIKNAKKTLEMAAIAGGEVYYKTVSAFKKALKKNPELIIHFYVSKISVIFSQTDEKLLEELKIKFPHRFHYCVCEAKLSIQRDKIYTSENHIKLLVVDEKYFVVGGTNLTDFLTNNIPPDSDVSLFPKAASDLDVVGRGPIAHGLRIGFFQIYELLESKESLNNTKGPFQASLKGYSPVAEGEQCVVKLFEKQPNLFEEVAIKSIFSGPRISQGAIGSLYTNLIENAQKEIYLGHMYFFPVDAIYQRLITAANRGIHLTLITNGTPGSGTVPSNLSYIFLNRHRYLPIVFGRHFNLIQYITSKYQVKNSEIYEFNERHVIYHKKTMVVDGRYAIVGSYNFGAKSEYADYEVAVAIDSEAVAQKIIDLLTADKAKAKRVSTKKIISWYFDPFYSTMAWLEELFLDGLAL